MEKRNKPIGFLLRSGRGGSPEDTGFAMATQAIWIDGPLKLVVSPTGGDDESVSVALYDIFADPAEKTNLAPQRIEDVQRMRAALNEWRTSVQASYDGKDFSQKE
jgi:hypothetical protein